MALLFYVIKPYHLPDVFPIACQDGISIEKYFYITINHYDIIVKE